MTALKLYGQVVQAAFQRLALLLICGFAALAVGATVLAAIGVIPWLSIPVAFGAEPLPQAGQWVQLGLTVLAVSLLFFLPTNGRVMALERSHRRFDLTMQDVARAYHAAHAADRQGVFRLPAEFDAVKERIEFLRDHPDLGKLEPEILEMAAKMSHLSHELALTYDDEKVERARTFLKQRQEEAETFGARVEDARHITADLKRWVDKVEAQEDGAREKLAALREELRDVLPELGLAHTVTPPSARPSRANGTDGRVIAIPHAAE